MCFTFCHLTLAVVFTFCHLTLAVVFSQNILKMCGPYDGTFIVAYCYLETNILQSDKSKNVHRNKYIIVFARYKSSHWSYPIKKVFLIFCKIHRKTLVLETQEKRVSDTGAFL